MSAWAKHKRTLLLCAAVAAAFLVAFGEIALNKSLEVPRAIVPSVGKTSKPWPDNSAAIAARKAEVLALAQRWKNSARVSPEFAATTPQAMSVVLNDFGTPGGISRAVTARDERERLWQFVQSHMQQVGGKPVPAAPLLWIEYEDAAGVKHSPGYNGIGFTTDTGYGWLTAEQQQTLRAIIMHYFEVF